jgi:ABC transport system ATP-binding/permease protein
MPTEAFASPLIVWFGPNRYTFPVGRDVTIGPDGRSDIRIDGAAPVVLHHNGRQWIAVDRGEGGIYVDGVRMSTVFIHDGRTIVLGDPQHGPRLVFQLGAPPPPPPIAPPPPRGVLRPGMRPAPPPPPAMRPPPQPPAPHRGPGQPGRPPVAPPPPRSNQPTRPPMAPATQFHPPAPPPAPWPTQPRPPGPPPVSWLPPPSQAQPGSVVAPPPTPRKRKAFVEALTGAMQKLRPHRPEPRPHEAAPTTALARPDAPDKPDVRETSAIEAPPPPLALKVGRLDAHQVRLTVDGEQVLAELSFTADPGTLTAVIGPSEVSTSALLDVLGGTVQPSVGTVHFDSHDVTGDHLRRHIGVVPRFDLLHPVLTVEQALTYAAELRMPPSTSADTRRQKVDGVLGEMKLSLLRTIQVRNLTAEQRKRASIAMELLTNPSLLVLDEPTAGFDAAAELEMTSTLRRLADEGRVVVVATTSPTDVEICDQVVLLTGTGTPAFAGPPTQIGAELGTTNWAEILERVNTDPYGAHDAHLAHQQEAPPEAEPPHGPVEPAARLHLWRQFAIAVRRQGWLTVGDQRYFIFLTILPVLFGAITLLVPGNAGLGPADPYGNSPDEAVEILAVLVIGAVIMGTALGIRDLVGERRIFRRDQANGLSASAFLAGKVVVYSLIAVVATAIMTTAAVVGKGAPTQGAVLLGDGAFQATFELFVVLAVTTIVSAMVALALSALASYSEQIILIAALIVLISVVFAGAMFPIDGRFGLEQISWFVPSRWGFAAAASTVDVHAVNLLAASDDSWKHSTGRWTADMAILIGFGVVATAALRWGLRRPARRR